MNSWWAVFREGQACLSHLLPDHCLLCLHRNCCNGERREGVRRGCGEVSVCSEGEYGEGVCGEGV